MVKDTVDIQSQKDKRNITINKVGVKNVKYPILVDDRKNDHQHTIADLDIFVELLHHHRGTHMSRFLEILNRYHEDNLIQKLPEFLSEIKESLNADAAYTDIKFPYFVKKKAPVSEIESLLSYDCFFQASYTDCYRLVIGVVVPITTLCPCSKEVSNYGAHNQRSAVTVKLEYNEFMWLEEIIEAVESISSCEIYSLLKRVDEKYVTEKAYENPKFVEDIIRDLAIKLKSDNRIDWFEIESENFESIHNHSAYGWIEWKRPIKK